MQPLDKNGRKSNYSFLIKSEYELLNGKGEQSISKNFHYKMLSNNKKKVRIFLENELPLLVENNLISFGYDSYNFDPNIVGNIENDNDFKEKVARSNLAQVCNTEN